MSVVSAELLQPGFITSDDLEKVKHGLHTLLMMLLDAGAPTNEFLSKAQLYQTVYCWACTDLMWRVVSALCMKLRASAHVAQGTSARPSTKKPLCLSCLTARAVCLLPAAKSDTCQLHKPVQRCLLLRRTVMHDCEMNDLHAVDLCMMSILDYLSSKVPYMTQSGT